uniref:Uncharacterized protein n=1 Tax=viral metagenome TaxID=1070528 RepID=A0A6C0IFJ2_9ZZZZ
MNSEDKENKNENENENEKSWSYGNTSDYFEYDDKDPTFIIKKETSSLEQLHANKLIPQIKLLTEAEKGELNRARIKQFFDELEPKLPSSQYGKLSHAELHNDPDDYNIEDYMDYSFTPSLTNTTLPPLLTVSNKSSPKIITQLQMSERTKLPNITKTQKPYWKPPGPSKGGKKTRRKKRKTKKNKKRHRKTK